MPKRTQSRKKPQSKPAKGASRKSTSTHSQLSSLSKRELVLLGTYAGLSQTALSKTTTKAHLVKQLTKSERAMAAFKKYSWPELKRLIGGIAIALPLGILTYKHGRTIADKLLTPIALRAPGGLS